jgi:shikimate kinase
MNIVLIGYRGTGKTAVGRKLADRLNLAFFDADDLVEKRFGQSIAEMVAAAGWALFREREREMIRELSESDHAVIATGGGAILDPGNVARLKHNGRLVWLRADAQTVLERLQAEPDVRRRPSLTGAGPAEETADVMQARQPFYSKAADLCVDTSGKSLEQVVDEICSRLEEDAA